MEVNPKVISPGKEQIEPVISSFINSIGIRMLYATLEQDTFLPGIFIDRGVLVVDKKKLLYPGDLLHEAGHIAVMKEEDRYQIQGNVGIAKKENEAAGEELMAIAWSYAALVHLKLSPEIVFHPQGYKGASEWYIDLFCNGTYIGLPMLQWIGMCYDQANAQIHKTKPYPYMQKWLRN